MALKPLVTSFDGTVRVYEVHTAHGGAYTRKGYGDDVDIGKASRTVLSDDAARLFANTSRMRIQNEIGWPGEVRLVASTAQVVTLSIPFSAISALTEKSRRSGKPDALAAALASTASANRLTPVGPHLIFGRTDLKDLDTASLGALDLEEIDTTMGKAYTLPKIIETMRDFPNAAHLGMGPAEYMLGLCHALRLSCEAAKPGFEARQRRLVIAGLYAAADAKTVTDFPLPAQDKNAATLIAEGARSALRPGALKPA